MKPSRQDCLTATKNRKRHEVEPMELNKKRNMEMTAKAPSDLLNYAMDNGHEKKPEDERQHDGTYSLCGNQHRK